MLAGALDQGRCSCCYRCALGERAKCQVSRPQGASMTAAAITATFSDYRLVKSRGVLQLVLELPVERQAQAFEALGFPMPGTDIHVGVARLQPVTGSSAAPAIGARP